MFCLKCGKEIPSDTTFCQFCGKKQDEAPSEEQPNEIFQRVEAGKIEITHEGKQGLIGCGYFIYVDNVKYHTSDFPKGITVKVKPGTHHIFASASAVTTDKIRNIGKKASKAGSLIGGIATLGGEIVNLSTKLGTGIQGDRGTCSRHINVNGGETVKIKVVLKKGIFMPTITIEEI